MTLDHVLKNKGLRMWAGWIHLTHDRDQWRVFVHTVMNLRVP
jgi:hypothetical protein